MCSGAELGDQVKLVVGNVILLADPAAADSVDEGSGKELCHVFGVDAAGGDELQTDKGTGERLQCLQAAVDVGGEELNDFDARLRGHHNLGRSGTAGGYGDAVFAD